MTWFPGWSWFLTPSGGPYPTPWSLWTVLSEAPLPAHAAGGWLALLVAWPFSHRIPQLLLALIICGVWQAAKWNDEVYGASWLREIFWRLLISAVALLPVWWFR